MLLYKYVSPNAIDWILEKRTVSFTSVVNLNDPFESGQNLASVIEKERKQKDQKRVRALADFLGRPPTREEYAAQLQALAAEGLTEELFDRGLEAMAWKVAWQRFREFGVLSLTSNPRNLLMWSHYASSGKGFVIGFDTSANPFSDSNYGGMTGVQTITYSDERADTSAPTLSERLSAICLTKGLEWSYEEESRCIRQIIGGAERLSMDIDPSCIRELIIGPQMSEDDVTRILEIHKTAYPHVKLLLALPSPDKFEMNLGPMFPLQLFKLFISDDVSVKPIALTGRI